MLTCTVHVTVAICFHWRVLTRQCIPNATKTLRRDMDATRQSINFPIVVFSLVFWRYWRASYTSAVWSLSESIQSFFEFWRGSFTSKANILWWPFLSLFDVCPHVNDTLFSSLTCGSYVTEANFFYWRVRYTSVHAKCEKMVLDVWLTRQWYMFFSIDVWSTRHWSEFLLLTCLPHVTACGFLKNLVFPYHWRVDETSAKP